jgi:hypothetical protein
MTGRLIVAAALLAIAGGVAFAIERRRGRAPIPVRDRYRVPRQLARADFPRPEAPWLVVVFSADRCGSCVAVRPKVAVLESAEVATVDVEEGKRRDLHERYGVDAAPLTLVADSGGVVVRAFFGNVTATDLWAAVADARNPGTSPEHHLGLVERQGTEN